MREFASQKALISYAERKGLIYLWEARPHLPDGNGCSRGTSTSLPRYGLAAAA
jgi:hypothetical protein